MAMNYPDVNELKHTALLNFMEQFSENATVCVYAPGRVNLIGEHTDYNDGFVLPMALPLITMIVGKPNNMKRCKIISMSEAIGDEKICEFDCSNHAALKAGDPKWSNYVKGCLANFKPPLIGFNAVIVSTIPIGAGLSSSAALEVATYTFLESITKDISIKPKDKVLACQRAEHEFAGVPCGIMDQFISIMGLEGHALLLDCRDFITKQIPMSQMDNYIFIITNSNTSHKLTLSAYHERRTSCYAAAKVLNKTSLREANIRDIETQCNQWFLCLALKNKNVSDIMIKRARHVITEIQRTIEAATCLENNNFIRFGELMNESHDSLREEYEVSSKELDNLVMISRSVDGVLGSRLTGAGFGGCTITLVKKNAVDNLIATIQKKYSGIPSFYVAKPSNGARQLHL
ncbi:PREDICTED: galactokinase-like [Ceratosolen solmsi marchali]|uniref:Galactokinase-like n=1 Tax=Ceratosolen solmsi marchali TaxID=326594 RepID=A0AAJ7E0U4_9HYME|nr:PREDICTED: galactokinase-like [Ceratosolen solmsi marchali]